MELGSIAQLPEGAWTVLDIFHYPAFQTNSYEFVGFQIDRIRREIDPQTAQNHEMHQDIQSVYQWL